VIATVGVRDLLYEVDGTLKLKTQVSWYGVVSG